MGNKTTKATTIVPLPTKKDEKIKEEIFGFPQLVKTARTDYASSTKAVSNRKSEVRNEEKNSVSETIGQMTSPRTVKGSKLSQLSLRKNSKISPMMQPIRPLDKIMSDMEYEESNEAFKQPSLHTMEQQFSEALKERLFTLQQKTARDMASLTVDDNLSVPSARVDLNTNIITIPASSLQAISKHGMGLYISTNNSPHHSTSHLPTKSISSTPHRSRQHSSNLFAVQSSQITPLPTINSSMTFANFATKLGTYDIL